MFHFPRCDICQKTFVSVGGLRSHMTVKHAKEKEELPKEDKNVEVICSICDKV